jgi:hypothetical protein
MKHCSSPSNERSKPRSGDTAGVVISKYLPGWKKRPKNRIAFITAPIATAAANASIRTPVGIAKVAVERKLRGLPDLPDRSSHRTCCGISGNPVPLIGDHSQRSILHPPTSACCTSPYGNTLPSCLRRRGTNLASGFYKTEIDFLSRRSDNYPVGGRAAPTCAVATRDHVLTTAKALDPGAASGRPNPT